jgi:hypothetical protein
MADDTVTVASYAYPVEAEMARMKLESEGIECVISNQTSAHMMIGPGAPGVLLLQVQASNVDRARAVLAEGSSVVRREDADGWSDLDEVTDGRELAELFALTESAVRRVGKLVESNAGALTIEGVLGGWLFKTRMRVDIRQEDGSTKLRLSVRGPARDWPRASFHWTRLLKELGIDADS